VRSLREARGFTQEILAERSGLSSDTIRRLERGGFSPSLDTLTKLAQGLGLKLSTLFTGYELGAREIGRELVDLLTGRSARDHELGMALLRIVFEMPNDGTATNMDDEIEDQSSFGAHIKRLREVRRMTQEQLAERSGLAADTIRRLEHQDFSPTLRTLRRVCKGMEVSVARMFAAFELDAVPEEVARISGQLIGRSSAELKLLERLVAILLADLENR
jgi:transcriptional regulator with XRE-family HTH domain